MPGLGIFFVLSVAAGVTAALVHSKKKKVDVELYLRKFRRAARDYRNVHGDVARDIDKLQEYLDDDVEKNDRLSLSLDGLFLKVEGVSETEAEELIQVAGGESFFQLVPYLALFEPDVPMPVARFTYSPSEVMTTTPVNYDTSDCNAHGLEITEYKWKNNQRYFKEAGTYDVTLSIKDSEGNWSDSYEQTIVVNEAKGIKKMIAYEDALYLLFNNGKCFAKGKNSFGEFGNGSLSPLKSLSLVGSLEALVDVACGDGFNIYHFADHTIGSSGINKIGQLGLGDTQQRKSIGSIWGLEHILQIDTGRSFSAALLASGEVYLWGDNSEHQLSRNDLFEMRSPLLMEELQNIKQIALGPNFGLALSHNGVVFGWGNNAHGQLGTGDKNEVVHPVETLYKNAVSVHCGDRFSMVITKDGTVEGSGYNNYNQLGSGKPSVVMTPSLIAGADQVETLYVQQSLTAGVKTDGTLIMWGNSGSISEKAISNPTVVDGIEQVAFVANNGRKLFVITEDERLYNVNNPYGPHGYSEISFDFVKMLKKSLKDSF